MQNNMDTEQLSGISALHQREKPPLHKPAIAPYLQQELSNLYDHNPPISNPF